LEGPRSSRAVQTNDVSQVTESGWNISMRLPALRQQGRQVLLGVLKTNVRCKKPYPSWCIGLDEVPNTAAQHGTDQDIRVEYDHLNEKILSRADGGF
jgi:hypothetical protein